MKLKYRIERDEFDGSPRDWDNLGTMICGHRRYNLGDEQLPSNDIGSWLSATLSRQGIERVGIGGNWTDHWYDFIDDLEYGCKESISKAWDLLDSKIITLPLYLYDHSGLTMKTVPFSCPWDSGQVGFIYVSIADVKDEWGWKYLTAKRRERIEGYLRNEVEEYDQYLTGDVWGYIIEDEDGGHIDSCWGFYGYDYCETEAKRSLDWQIKEHESLNEFERVA